MHLINNIALPPTELHMAVNKYLTFGAEFVFLLFFGLLSGALFWSIWFSVLYQNTEKPPYLEISRYLIKLAAVNTLVVLGFGLVPLLTLIMLFAQGLLDTTSPGPFNVEGFSQLPTAGLIAAVPLILSGLVLAILYKRSFSKRTVYFWYHVIVGVAAMGALMLGMLVVSISFAMSVDPEKWMVINNPIEFFVASWSGIVRFLIVGPLSWAIIGSTAVFAYRSLSEIGSRPEDGTADFVRTFGSALVLGACLGLPALVFWQIDVLPNVAASVGLHVALGLGVAALALAAHAAYKMLVYGSVAGAGAVLAMVVAFVLLYSWGDSMARHSALRDHYGLLVAKAEADELERVSVREARLAMNEKPDPAKGAEVYQKVCTSCHAFDRKVVGPPYNAVLGKYEGKIEQLKAFISNPHKVDPAYPAMPKLGLPAGDVASVAAYLMQEHEKAK